MPYLFVKGRSRKQKENKVLQKLKQTWQLFLGLNVAKVLALQPCLSQI
jgi:hypothetical protein